jgi:ankyrin repeat protein
MKPLARELLSALYAENTARVRDLLEQDPTLASYPEGTERYTALHHAAGLGKPDVVRLLLRYGASVRDSDNVTGRTPLHAAAEAVDPDMVLLLLRVGAGRRTVDRNGDTPAVLCHWQAGTALDFVERQKRVIRLLGGLPSSFDPNAPRPERRSYGELLADWIADNGRPDSTGCANVAHAGKPNPPRKAFGGVRSYPAAQNRAQQPAIAGNRPSAPYPPRRPTPLRPSAPYPPRRPTPLRPSNGDGDI